MLDFTYENQTRLVFGREAISQLGAETRKLGDRALLVYGGGSVKQNGLYDRVMASLIDAGVTVVELSGIEPNPKMRKAYEGIELMRAHSLNVIIALGGGSVIDTAKTIGMGALYDGDVWDFYTGTQATKMAPLGVVLTIPAAGSESSTDAVMTLEQGKLKRASCSGDFVRPRFALMDPTVTFTLPDYQTACGASDIIAHVLERYFTRVEAVDTTDRLCESLIRSAMRAVRKILKNPLDYDARAELMLCGTYAHNNMVGVGRQGDWASHMMGHELSALYEAAHGATLAVVFPAWMRTVYQTDIARFAKFAHRVLDVPYDADDEAGMALLGIDRFERFLREIGLPTRLPELGASAEDIPVMAKKCHACGNFVALDEAAIAEVYRKAL